MAHLIKGRWPKLAALQLADSFLQDNALQPFSLVKWTQLRILRLRDCSLNSTAIAHIAAALPSLTSLELSGNTLDNAAVQQFVGGQWPHLLELNLTACSLSSRGVGCTLQELLAAFTKAGLGTE